MPVAVARFAVKETGQEFYLFNVHLGGGAGSTRSAQLILDELSSIVQKTPDPVNVILLGDFNAKRGGEAWSVLAGEEYLPFRDSWITASNRIGEEARIDWILYSGSLKPLSCETIRYTVNERHVSDHPAVQANFIFEAVEPSKYEYGDLGFSSTEVETGRELEVKTTITNLGGLGSPEVGLYVNERLVDTKWLINIQSGKSREVTFATALYQPGGYRIGIDNLPPQTVKVVKSAPLIQLGVAASFQLSSLTLPEIILVGKEFDVAASIKNEGRYRSSANVNLYVDGWLTQSTIVDLSPGESRIVGFPLALLKEGTHEVGIGPISGIVEVAMEPPMVFQDMSDNGNDARVFGGAHWVQGKVGRAIRLNGVDAYAEVEHSELFNVQRGFTIAVWFKVLDYGLMAGQNYLVADEGYPFGWEIEVRGTGPYFEINTKEDPAQEKPHCWHLWGQTPLEANRWYFSVFTIDSDGSMKMYLNGEEEPFRESTKEGMIELE